MDSNTFDLAAALSGQTYPEETVIVPLDRKAAKDLHEAREEFRLNRYRRDSTDDYLAGLQDRIEALETKVRENCLYIDIQGLPRHAAKNLAVTNSKIGEEKREPAKESVTEFNVRIGIELQKNSWAAYITEIRFSDGSVAPLNEDTITTLVEGISDPGAELIMEAIKALDNDARAGFESIVTNEDF